MGSTISPHVASWSERIRVDGAEADFEEAVARVRVPAERARGDAVRDRHRGGAGCVRRRARRCRCRRGGAGGAATTRRTSCRPGSCSSRTSGSSTPTSSATRSRRSRPRSSPWRPSDAIVVLPDETYVHLVPGRDVVVGGAREAAEAFVGHADHGRSTGRRFPGGSSAATARSGTVRTIPTVRGTSSNSSTATTTRSWPRSSPTRTSTRCFASFVAWVCASSPRARPRLALSPPTTSPSVARRHFDHVEVVDDPVAAVARAHELGEPVLVTGSLYLLGDLAQEERRASWRG